MHRFRLMRALLWGTAGACLIAGVLIIGWWADGGVGISAAAAVLGGVGSAVGGIAAAVAATRSRAAAESSDHIAETMAQLSRDSRIALGRTMRPTLLCTFRPDRERSMLHVENVGNWPARDVSVEITVPGAPHYVAELLQELGIDATTNRVEFKDPPLLPDDDELWEFRDGNPGVASLASTLILRFSDRDRILRHTTTYRILCQRHPSEGWASMFVGEPEVVQISEEEL